MRYSIVKESSGLLHLKLARGRLSTQEADILYYALTDRLEVIKASVFPRTGEVTVRVRRDPEALLSYLDSLQLTPEAVKMPAVSARATNEHYKEKIIDMFILRGVKRFVLPAPIRTALTFVDAAPFVWNGIKDIFRKKFSAEIVHASAISASLLIGDFPTASSITFLTEVGEVLEEWTYKKSVDDLAQSLSLNISRVWKVTDGPDELVNIENIKVGDKVRVTMGNMIPLDGVVAEGEALVNQAALTGEPLAV